MSLLFTLFLVTLLSTLVACQGEIPPTPADTPPAHASCPSFVPRSTGLPMEGEWRTHPAVGDINGDGLDDIAALPRRGNGPRVFLSNGLGDWTEASEGLQYPNGFSCGIGTRLADLNDDGFLDLVVADHCEGVFVYRGDGGHSWTPSPRGIPTNRQGFNDVDVGDIDGDGIVDLVAIAEFTQGFMVLKGLGNMTWEMVEDTGLPLSGGGFEVHLVDVNGDDRLDVVSTFIVNPTDRRNVAPPKAKLWLQDAPGKFQPVETFPTEGRFFGVTTWLQPDGQYRGLLFGLVGARSGLYLFPTAAGDTWTDGGRIDEPWFGERPGGFVGVDVVEVDGDGCADLVATELMSRKAWLALGDCEGSWTFCPEETLPYDEPEGASWGVETGDFNGDGLTDVVAAFGSQATGSLRAWLQVAGSAKIGAIHHEQGPAELRPERGSGAPVPEP